MVNQSNAIYQNIAIVKLSSLGDIIHTLPAFQLLRKKFPFSKISWIVEPSGFQLLTNFKGIDELISVNLKTKGIFNKIKELKRILSTYRKRFDLIIDFQGLIKSALLSSLLRGYLVGFHKKNLKEPIARFFYNKSGDYFKETSHVIYKNIHLLSFLNINDQEIYYPLNQLAMTNRLKKFIADNRLIAKKFVILNIGGGWSTKILETNQYIKIVKGLETKYKIVILWGNEKESKIAEKISINTNSIKTGYLNFKELIQFVDHACLVITSDTLVMHIADMVKTPSVGLFGPTSPDRNGSLLKDSVAIYNELSCSFCYNKKCDTIDCLKYLNIEKVIKAVIKIYEKCS